MKCILMALLLCACTKHAATPTFQPEAIHGELLPSPKPLIDRFTATAQDGTPRDPTDLMGHPTVIWFFPAANTSGCTVEGCGYRDLHGSFAELGVRVVGISFTPVELNAAWSAKLEFPYEIWHDNDKALASWYGAIDDRDAKYPSRRTRVLNTEGKVVLEYNKSIIVGAHPEEVLNDVRALVAAARL